MCHVNTIWRRVAFAVGDVLFLLLVAMLSTATMHLFHELHWNFAATLILGMVAAMAAQTVAALVIAPILGSIESMVPSMLVAMTSPMAVCMLDSLGGSVHRGVSLVLGAAVGGAVYVALHWYARACRRRLSRVYRGHDAKPLGLSSPSL